MNCRLCSSPIATSFADAKLLRREVQYFDCPNCGYVQTEEPTWLEEAYATSINSSDTGIMARNLSNVGLVLATLSLMGERNGQVVDYAGGNGFLVRLLRDKGVNAFWADPYSENLVARGFEYSGGKTNLITAFEAFEHFVKPLEEMRQLLSISSNILLTTNIIPRPAPQPSDWWYYGLDHGQHIGFYRVKTLEYLAEKFGLHLLTDGLSTHLLSKKKYSGLIFFTLKKFAKLFPNLFSIGLGSKSTKDHLCLRGKI